MLIGVIHKRYQGSNYVPRKFHTNSQIGFRSNVGKTRAVVHTPCQKHLEDGFTVFGEDDDGDDVLASQSSSRNICTHMYLYDHLPYRG